MLIRITYTFSHEPKIYAIVVIIVVVSGEMNNGFIGDAASVAGSRKSLNLHPVLLMHPGQDDTYSQFSQRTVPRSTHSGHYSHPMHHNFQL